MRIAVVLVAVLLAPSGAMAGPILESAERAAAELVQSGRVEVRRSAARVGIGLAVAAAGAAMLLVDPKQPVQPTAVSEDTLLGETAELLSDRDFFVDALLDVDRDAATIACRYPSTCGPYVVGAINGSVVGAAAALSVVTRDGRTVYSGPLQPFKERSPGLKYGGAALAIAGAALAGIWSTTTIVRDVAVSPTPGGIRVGSRVTF